MTALEVHGLRIDGPQGTIVDGLDLSVGEGETIGIVGESGSGKSLTARALVGLLPTGLRATGSIQFRGRELLGARERAWREVRGREVALLLQDPFTMLNPLMKVGVQIAETAARRGSAAARLAEVGIRDPRSPSSTRSSSRAACASGSGSPPRSRAIPQSSSPTNRRPPST